jgi:poly-gamma-glutamate capsule biosynthesis protein CapA/YwtB (metallophosphatase superfamily)
MAPFQTRRFRLQRVGRSDAEWLRRTLDRESRPLGAKVELTESGGLALLWS